MKTLKVILFNRESLSKEDLYIYDNYIKGSPIGTCIVIQGTGTPDLSTALVILEYIGERGEVRSSFSGLVDSMMSLRRYADKEGIARIVVPNMDEYRRSLIELVFRNTDIIIKFY